MPEDPKGAEKKPDEIKQEDPSSIENKIKIDIIKKILDEKQQETKAADASKEEPKKEESSQKTSTGQKKYFDYIKMGFTIAGIIIGICIIVYTSISLVKVPTLTLAGIENTSTAVNTSYENLTKEMITKNNSKSITKSSIPNKSAVKENKTVEEKVNSSVSKVNKFKSFLKDSFLSLVYKFAPKENLTKTISPKLNIYNTSKSTTKANFTKEDMINLTDIKERLYNELTYALRQNFTKDNNSKNE